MNYFPNSKTGHPPETQVMHKSKVLVHTLYLMLFHVRGGLRDVSSSILNCKENKKTNLTSKRQKMEGKKYFPTRLSLKTSCSSRCHNMYVSKFQFKKYNIKNFSLTLASYQ